MNKECSFSEKKGILARLRKNFPFIFMVLPGASLLLVFAYLPMTGILIAFKNLKFYSNSIFTNFFQSEWVGLKNFEFFFKTPDAYTITKHTVLYNLVFIILGVLIPVACAIGLNEINTGAARFYQSSMLLPYFLSWVVVSYLVYSLLNPDYGMVNKTLESLLGREAVDWYTNLAAWPFIFCLLNVWKYSGYGTVIYLAAITGISNEFYESATIDGASKWQQIIYITIPNLRQIMCILTILAVGRIFNGDFGLFFQSSMQLGSGFLKPVGEVIDTYVYGALVQVGDIGMASAASLYQSTVGCILVVLSNMLVRKIDRDSALF